MRVDARKNLMSDTGMVLKNCRNRHFRGISFKMVHISTNYCVIEQQITAINKLFIVPIFSILFCCLHCRRSVCEVSVLYSL